MRDTPPTSVHLRERDTRRDPRKSLTTGYPRKTIAHSIIFSVYTFAPRARKRSLARLTVSHTIRPEQSPQDVVREAFAVHLPVCRRRSGGRERDSGHVPSRCRQNPSVRVLLVMLKASSRTNVHRQIQGKAPIPGQDHYTSMVDCFQKIIKNEGFEKLRPTLEMRV